MQAIRLVVDRPAGTPHDLLVRAVADKLSLSLKQPIIIENRPGAGGNIALEYVVRSKSDGYTLLVAVDTTLTVNPIIYKTLQIDPETALRPLAIFGKNNEILAVHPSVPVHSVNEFVSYAKTNPITYGHGGIGSPGHLTMEYFRILAGFSATPVPYRGNIQVVTGFLSGEIKFAFLPNTGVMSYVERGQLKGIAVTSEKRIETAPTIPTIAESGYPGFNVEAYYVILAPAGVPAPIIEKLEREIALALQSRDLKERFQPLDISVVSIIGPEAALRLKSVKATWEKVLSKVKLSVQ